MAANLLATDNEFDIPSLRLEWQATRIPAPVIGWGTLGRSLAMPGTYHCYVDDAKFSNLLCNPDKFLRTGCKVSCEPNVSIYDQTPRFEALAAIGRKRAAAATWGAAGVALLVDMNVPERFLGDNLLGVPLGWHAYSTRGYRARIDDLLTEYAVAAEHARGVPLFLVVGGGERAREACLGLPGAICVNSELGSEKAKRVSMQRGNESGIDSARRP